MSTNDIWAVVPIKELDGAKQRLAPLLTPAQRRALIEVMMNEVLEAVTTTPAWPASWSSPSMPMRRRWRSGWARAW